MPIGLFPNTGPRKSESVAISASYSDLSTICWPPNTARGGGPFRRAADLQDSDVSVGLQSRGFEQHPFPLNRIFFA